MNDQIIMILGTVIITSLLIVVGYWLGRKTRTNEPMIEKKEKPFNQGSTAEPPGDLFNDAMGITGIENKDERIKAGL